MTDLTKDSSEVRRGVAVSAVTQTGAKGLHLVLNVISTLAIIRYLSPSEYGDYVLVLTASMLVGLVADFGLSKLATREISQDLDSESEVLGTILLARLCLALLCIGLLQVVLLAIGVSAQLHLAALGGVGALPRRRGARRGGRLLRPDQAAVRGDHPRGHGGLRDDLRDRADHPQGVVAGPLPGTDGGHAGRCGCGRDRGAASLRRALPRRVGTDAVPAQGGAASGSGPADQRVLPQARRADARRAAHASRGRALRLGLPTHRVHVPRRGGGRERGLPAGGGVLGGR